MDLDSGRLREPHFPVVIPIPGELESTRLNPALRSQDGNGAVRVCARWQLFGGTRI
jgi:hypothetical protein